MGHPSPPHAHRADPGSHRRPRAIRRTRRTWLVLAAAPMLVQSLIWAAPEGALTAASASSRGASTLWPDSSRPAVKAVRSSANRMVGTRFTTSSNGRVTSLRFFKSARNHGRHIGYLWDASGRQLAKAVFRHESRSGWQRAKLGRPVALGAGQTYVVGYRAKKGHYSTSPSRFSRSHVTRGALTATSGVIGDGRRGFPTGSSAAAYFVDVVFQRSATAASGAGGAYTPMPASRPGAVGCWASPSSCGYPDASNTGVTPGTQLRSVPSDVSSGPGWHWDPRGWLEVDGDGAVLSGLSVNASIEVMADNVTIRDSRIQVTGQSWGIGLRHTANARMIHNDIFSPAASGPDRLMVGIKDVYGDSTGLLAAANDIWHASTGIQLGAGTVVDNYIHDLAMTPGDHVNGFSSNGANGALVLQHNSIFNPMDQTDAIALFPDFGPQQDRLIQDNFLAGGGYTLYGGYDLGKGNGPTSGIVIRGNRLSRAYYSKGGSYGWLAHYNPSDPGNSLSGNVWDDNGAAAS